MGGITNPLSATAPIVEHPGGGLRAIPTSPSGGGSSAGAQGLASNLVPYSYPVVFHERNSDNLTVDWWVNLSGNNQTNTGPGGVISFSEPNGTYNFTVGGPWSYPINRTASGSSPVTVAGQPVSVNISFDRQFPGPLYPVSFRESGLPNGSTWQLQLNLSHNGNFSNGLRYRAIGATLNVSLPNASYYVFGIAPAGSTLLGNYVVFNVTGHALTVALRFAPPVSHYDVWFGNVGLTNATNWSVTVGGTLNRAHGGDGLGFGETNGSYSFSVARVPGFTASVSSGNLTVAGRNVVENVTFYSTGPSGLTTFAVRFTEQGLPRGTPWWVAFDGANLSSPSASIPSFLNPNGSYAYQVGCSGVGNASGYGPVLASGSVKVAGQAVNVTISFAAPNASNPVSFSVAFVETGLPSGTAWWVRLGGSTRTSTTSSIAFLEPNGTYVYSAGAGAAFALASSTGSVTVRGAAQQKSFQFSPSGSGGTTVSSVPLDSVAVGLGLVALAVAVAVVALTRRRVGGVEATARNEKFREYAVGPLPRSPVRGAGTTNGTRPRGPQAGSPSGDEVLSDLR